MLMKPGLTLWLLSGMTLGIVTSCNNINRDSEDVSARAATLSADTLRTMQLSELGSVGREENTSLSTDTVPDNSSTALAPPAAGDDSTYIETEVVQIDTIATRTVYDIKRRTIEQVDTVGATKTYEIRKRVLKRTVMLDTLTETVDQEQTVAFQEGDYKVLNEQVREDSAVKVVDYQQSKQQEAKARANTQTPVADPAQQPVPPSTMNRPSQSDSTTQSTTAQPSNPSTQVDSLSRSSTTRPSSPPNSSAPDSSSQVRTSAPSDTTQQPATGTARQDTTRQRSRSGS